jgi:hypothetical protein
MLSLEVKEYIDKSVLCWLATSNLDGQPNVSPKEVFTHFNDQNIIIANIASPNTVKNIKQNSKVCLSFIEVFIQKGFQLKGHANIITKKDEGFKPMELELLKITKGLYPFGSITKIQVESVNPIIAPSYILYPDKKVSERILDAKRSYGL